MTAGYKMVGNAVPPNLATVLAKKIYEDLKKLERFTLKNHKVTRDIQYDN
jgi:hypothetical protein